MIKYIQQERPPPRSRGVLPTPTAKNTIKGYTTPTQKRACLRQQVSPYFVFFRQFVKTRTAARLSFFFIGEVVKCHPSPTVLVPEAVFCPDSSARFWAAALPSLTPPPYRKFTPVKIWVGTSVKFCGGVAL